MVIHGLIGGMPPKVWMGLGFLSNGVRSLLQKGKMFKQVKIHYFVALIDITSDPSSFTSAEYHEYFQEN